MMSNAYKVLKLIVQQPSVASALIVSASHRHLRDIGWTDSFIHQSPVDGRGNPVPWLTYAFTEFLEKRLHPNMKLLEFGSGNSTLYFQNRIDKIFSVEHDNDWYQRISKNLNYPEHLRLVDLDKDGEYCRSGRQFGVEVDLVLVDGRDRINCIKQSLTLLSESGVLILDDSERSKYQGAFNVMHENGYRHLSFSGLTPGLLLNKSTTVFYRENNCLDI